MCAEYSTQAIIAGMRAGDLILCDRSFYVVGWPDDIDAEKIHADIDWKIHQEIGTHYVSPWLIVSPSYPLRIFVTALENNDLLMRPFVHLADPIGLLRTTKPRLQKGRKPIYKYFTLLPKDVEQWWQIQTP